MNKDKLLPILIICVGIFTILFTIFALTEPFDQWYVISIVGLVCFVLGVYNYYLLKKEKNKGQGK